MISQNVILWICVVAVLGIGAYNYHKDTKKTKPTSLKKTKIIHLEHNGKYACNEAIKPTKEKLTEDWKNVTCKNCRNVKFYTAT